MSTIDGLFEQIIHSEKAALKKKNLFQDCKLGEVRQAVYTTQERGKQLEKTCSELKNTFRNKVEELSKKELTEKWLTNQECIYQKQKRDIQTCVDELAAQQKCVKNKCMKERVVFCEKLSSFCSQYGLDSKGFEDRQLIYQEQLASLEKEHENLTANLQVYTEKEASIKKCCEEKNSLTAQLQKLNTENEKIVSSLCDELQNKADLEVDCQAVSDVPHSDTQFISLQNQLEEEKRISVQLDHQCTLLQAQLHTLHEGLWKKQLQQRQHQKLQQQQQQQQQQQNQQNADRLLTEECSEEIMEELFSDSEDFCETESNSQGQGHQQYQGHVDPQGQIKPEQAPVTSRKNIFKSN